MACMTRVMGFAKRGDDCVVFVDVGDKVQGAPPQAFFAVPKFPRTRNFPARAHFD